MNNKKGFTLVELLAAIVILGLILGIGFVVVRNVLEKSHTSYMDQQLKLFLSAGESYFQDNKKVLPLQYNTSSTVTLGTLQEQKYIGVIRDYKGVICKSEKSVVAATRIAAGQYKYEGQLTCGGKNYKIPNDFKKPGNKDETTSSDRPAKFEFSDYSSSEENSELKPKISSIPGKDKIFKATSYLDQNYGYSNTSGNGQIKYYTNNKVKVFATMEFGENIVSYYYRINKIVNNQSNLYKEGEGIEESTNKITDKEVVEISKDDIADGEYTIQIQAYTASGKTIKSVESPHIIFDTQPPVCNNNSISPHSGSTLGKNGWYRSRLSLHVNTENSDKNMYVYNLYSNEAYKNKYYLNEFEPQGQGDTKGTTWYTDFIDKAGNTTQCQRTFKVDTTPPTCSLKAYYRDGKNHEMEYPLNTNKWVNTDVKMVAKCLSDIGSGCSSKNQVVGNYTISKGTNALYTSETNGSVYNFFDKYYKGFISIEYAGAAGPGAGNNLGGTIEDVAGNVATCPTSRIQIDKIEPQCKVTGFTENKPQKHNVTISAECDDKYYINGSTTSYREQSGCRSEYTTTKKRYYCCDSNSNDDNSSNPCYSSTKECSNKQKDQIVDSSKNGWCTLTNAGAAGDKGTYTVKDKAGNETNCDNGKVFIDRQQPTIKTPEFYGSTSSSGIPSTQIECVVAGSNNKKLKEFKKYSSEYVGDGKDYYEQLKYNTSSNTLFVLQHSYTKRGTHNTCYSCTDELGNERKMCYLIMHND